MQPPFDANHGRKQLQSDSYCWTCHKDEPDLFCSTCVRSFHISPSCSGCRGLAAEQVNTWRCSECFNIDNGIKQLQAKKFDHKHFNDVLQSIYKSLIEDKILADTFMDIQYLEGDAVNRMDFRTISRKIDTNVYISLEDFLADVKWIVHNTKTHCLGGNDIAKAVKSLNSFIKDHLICIQWCFDCYMRWDDDWFTSLCDIPHLLIWAKPRTYPYWPAKLLRYNNKNKTVNILFFGKDNYRAVLPIKNCLLFSQRNPSTVIGNRHKKALEIAQKEIGNTNIPSPISKPQPAGPKKDHRTSVSVQKMAINIPFPPVLNAGRPITRRMLTVLDEHPEEITLTECNDNLEDKINRRRQSVQPDSLPIRRIVQSHILLNKKTENSTAQKQKTDVGVIFDMPDLSFEPLPSKRSNNLQTPPNDETSSTVFKVPAVPPKANKRTLNNEIIAHSIISQEPQNKRSRPTNLDFEFTSETIPLCSSVVAKNVKKMSAVIQNSLTDTWYEFIEISNPDEKIREMQEKIEQNKQNYDRLVNALRKENGDLKAKITKLTENCESSALKESNSAKKITELTDKLKKSHERRALIEGDLSSVLTRNTLLNATVTRVLKSNIELANNLKGSEATSKKLNNTNIILTMEYNNLVKQLNEANKECDLIKNKARDQCAETVENTKKHRNVKYTVRHQKF